MKEKFMVTTYKNGGGNYESKEFDTHEDAIQYIKDMLKYHDFTFEIKKFYKKGE